MSSPFHYGEVKYWNGMKGFGAITPEEGGEIFVYPSGIAARGFGFPSLEDGQRVRYTILQGEKATAVGVEVMGDDGQPIRTPQGPVPRGFGGFGAQANVREGGYTG